MRIASPLTTSTFSCMIILFLVFFCELTYSDAPRLGMGARSGEITENSAIVQIRLTKSFGQERNFGIPGKAGKARIHLSTNDEMADTMITGWQDASEENDYYLQYHISDLKPKQRYFYRAELKDSDTMPSQMSEIFSFKTAPLSTDRNEIMFQVTTCQSAHGLPTYTLMQRQKPDFLISAGDTVYYDRFDVRSKEEAYWLYQKQYGTPYTINYLAHIPAYFMKDDHDYRYNDADPFSNHPVRFQKHKDEPNGLNPDFNRADNTYLTHEEGIEVFRQVFPSSNLPYRTFRWGKGAQIWLLEGRDFRSDNTVPDGPKKTIWGNTQKAWLKRTILESDADFRLVVSPTPIIGPDKLNKIDNHANANGFMHEGRAFLDWMIKEQLHLNTFLITGDRHWQYHSIYSDLVHEFSSGPTSHFKVHRVPKPKKGVIKQPYNGPVGGFMSVTYKDMALTFTHFDERGRRQNTKSFKRRIIH